MFLLPSLADAQVKFGVKVGANVGNASINKDLFSSGNRLGIVFGPLLDAKIPIIGLGFDIAVQYSCKNSQLDANEETDLASGVASVHSIEIPFNAKWTFGDDDIISAYAATGPQIGWNIGGKNLRQIFEMQDYKIKKSLFSWNFGAGITFLSNFRLGYNYNIAVGATAEVDYENALGDIIHGKLRNNTHQIFLVHYF